MMTLPEWFFVAERLVAFLDAVLRHPMIVISYAALLAYLYQNRSKNMEFRYQLFREAIALRSRAVPVLYQLLEARLSFAAAVRSRASQEQTSKLAHREERLQRTCDSVYEELSTLSQALPTLFSRATQQSWLKLQQSYGNARFERNPSQMEPHLRAVTEHGASCVELVAKEVPLPYKPATILADEHDPDAIKKAITDVEEGRLVWPPSETENED